MDKIPEILPLLSSAHNFLALHRLFECPSGRADFTKDIAVLLGFGSGDRSAYNMLLDEVHNAVHLNREQR